MLCLFSSSVGFDLEIIQLSYFPQFLHRYCIPCVSLKSQSCSRFCIFVEFWMSLELMWIGFSNEFSILVSSFSRFFLSTACCFNILLHWLWLSKTSVYMLDKMCGQQFNCNPFTFTWATHLTRVGPTCMRVRGCGLWLVLGLFLCP